jgi:hypothetical protein
MNKYYHPKRTIHMPPSRSQQIALAAASLDITSEDLIQSFITAGLLTMAEQDAPLAFALARAGGATFEQLTDLARAKIQSEAPPTHDFR